MPPRGNDDRYTRKCGRSTNIGHFDVHTHNARAHTIIFIHKQKPTRVRRSHDHHKKKEKATVHPMDTMYDRQVKNHTRLYTHAYTHTHAHTNTNTALEPHKTILLRAVCIRTPNVMIYI